MTELRIANNVRSISCPLCGSTDICQVGQLNYGGKIGFSSAEIVLEYLPELWMCKQCESAFVQNIIDADTARSLYSKGSAGERWQSKPFESEKTVDVVHRMAEIFQGKGAVLDVGCNTGELLDFAFGFGCVTSGVEFSHTSREVVRHKGHRVYESLENATGEYDVITAFDVIEHLYNVPAFLNACTEKLAKSGRLVLLTGNIDCLSAKYLGARWWYAQFPEHIVFPSRRYFSNYSGLVIEQWIPCNAAVGFEPPIYRKYFEILRGMLKGKAYTGLPSLVPDHALIVLRQ